MEGINDLLGVNLNNVGYETSKVGLTCFHQSAEIKYVQIHLKQQVLCLKQPPFALQIFIHLTCRTRRSGLSTTVSIRCDPSRIANSFGAQATFTRLRSVKLLNLVR